jgi:hypothetical protein
MTTKPPDTMADIAAIIEAVTDHLEYLMVTRDWPREAREGCWTLLAAEAMRKMLETPAAGHRAPKRRAERMGRMAP